MKIDFHRASICQAEALSNIALESKGYWGYSQAQLDPWRKDLRIEEEYIATNSVRTIHRDDRLVGFFAIKKGEENYLDHLWILPPSIGYGIGTLAFEKIIEGCLTLNLKEFLIVSDPDAEGFYLKQGAERIGEVESIPQNRMLPKLRYRIDEPRQKTRSHRT